MPFLMPDLPSTLLQTVRDQRAILFLGAGANFGAKHPSAAKIPLGDALRNMICDQFFAGELKDKPLVAVSAMALNEAGFLPFQRFIRETFKDFEPADYHRLIPQFQWRAIASTNFDLILERAYEAEPQRTQNLVKTVKDGDGFDGRMQASASPVGFYKLHGCVDSYTDEQIPLVLGNEQYASYSDFRKRFYDRLKDLAFENSIIFAGYSLADPHIQQILFDLTSKSISRPPYYCVAPNISDIEARYWAAHRITVVHSTFEDFLKSLDGAIPSIARKISLITLNGELSIKHHYRTTNPVETSDLDAYLEADVEHVHLGMVSATATARSFYSGHDQGWGAIVQNYDAKRKVVDSVLVDVILTSEADDRPADLYMLKGPAGNGKTVALKRIAWEAATSYDKLVFYARNAAGLQFSRISEIYQLVQKRFYLMVDRVALYRFELAALLRECRSRSIPVTVIGAERDNEWNIYCDALEPFLEQDFPVRYLTESEVRQLVDLLDRHNCLGVLKEKSPEERIVAFVSGAERQLLVALHEVTLGLPFERIVLDEYERIEPPEARRIYLEICSLHQFGAPVRAGLISRASGISYEDFAGKFFLPLENVVKVIEDKHTKDLAYQARHSHVAAMVFSQALPSPEDKYDLLVTLLDSMNVDYASDRETFSRMIKGRTISEIFADAALGRLFYDRAESAAPGDAFVPHQRAVFEINHPGGSLVLAEEAGQRARAINPNNRSIKHTLAEISRRKANSSDDPLLRQALRRGTRQLLSSDGARLSEFDFTTRARLAIDELRDILESEGDDPDRASVQVIEAAKEAETALEKGLQAFPESSLLMTAEASFHDLLNEKKQALAALKRAFDKNPRQDWLAARLARRYRDDGDPVAATNVLERCLRENPASKVAHLEMGHVLRVNGADPALILDHLRRSYTAGDNNYEAQFWYARELFVQDRFDDADAHFSTLHSKAPGRFRTRSSAEISDAGGAATRFEGRVERVEEGYAFISSAHVTRELFASRVDTEDQNWSSLASGERVQFQVGFNRRGARAMNVCRF